MFNPRVCFNKQKSDIDIKVTQMCKDIKKTNLFNMTTLLINKSLHMMLGGLQLSREGRHQTYYPILLPGLS